MLKYINFSSKIKYVWNSNTLNSQSQLAYRIHGLTKIHQIFSNLSGNWQQPMIATVRPVVIDVDLDIQPGL